MQLTKNIIPDNLLFPNHESITLDSNTKNLLQIAGMGLWGYDTERGELRYIGYADKIYSQGEIQHIDLPAYLSMMNEGDAYKVADYVRSMHSGECQSSVQYKIHENGEDFYLDNKVVSCTPLNTGYFITGYVQNITQQVQQEQLLAAAKEKAELSDRMKAAFLDNASQEIRTPLNAIVGFSSLIAQSDDKNAQQEYVKIVESNSHWLIRMIEGLFDLAKIQTGTYELNFSPVNLQTVFNNLRLEYQPQCPGNVEIIEEASNPFTEIVTDGKALYLVLSQLVENAIKHTPAGKIRVGFKTEEDQVTCFVRDGGKGIPANRLEYIFDSFAQSDHPVGKAGIGLSVCRTIIKELGGWIWAVSEPGNGATFSFSLPFKRYFMNKKEGIRLEF